MPWKSAVPVKIESAAPKWPRFEERVFGKRTPLFAIFIRFGTFCGRAERVAAADAAGERDDDDALRLVLRRRRRRRAEPSTGAAGKRRRAGERPGVFRKSRRVNDGERRPSVVLVLGARQDRVQDRSRPAGLRLPGVGERLELVRGRFAEEERAEPLRDPAARASTLSFSGSATEPESRIVRMMTERMPIGSASACVALRTLRIS